VFRFVATSLTVLARHVQGKHGPPREEKKKKSVAASAPVHTSVEEDCELLSDCESAPPSSPLPRDVMKSPDKDDLDPGDLTPQGAASSVVDISGTLSRGGGSMFDIVDEILEETTGSDSVPTSSSNSVPANGSGSVPCGSSVTVPANSSVSAPLNASDSVPANRTARADSPGSVPSRFKRQFHENQSASSVKRN
jgi:hypothetical protein